MTDKNWLYTMISRAQNQFTYFSTKYATSTIQQKLGLERDSLLQDFILYFYKEKKEKQKIEDEKKILKEKNKKQEEKKKEK
jgi:hypothetical protein